MGHTYVKKESISGGEIEEPFLHGDSWWRMKSSRGQAALIVWSYEAWRGAWTNQYMQSGEWDSKLRKHHILKVWWGANIYEFYMLFEEYSEQKGAMTIAKPASLGADFVSRWKHYKFKLRATSKGSWRWLSSHERLLLSPSFWCLGEYAHLDKF